MHKKLGDIDQNRTHKLRFLARKGKVKIENGSFHVFYYNYEL